MRLLWVRTHLQLRITRLPSAPMHRLLRTTRSRSVQARWPIVRTRYRWEPQRPAVSVNQMQQSVNTGVKSAKGYTDALRSDMNTGLSLANNHINSVGAMSSAMAMMAGSAAAVADKDNRFAAGTGVYRNKAAIALGFQKRFGTNMVITVGGSTTGEESTGGAGFAFGF